MKSKTTKRALLSSCIALMLCFSMLLGTTYAWFTDSETSVNNIIKSGTLDVEMYYGEDGVNWNDITEAQESIFNYEYWEPGYTDVKYIKIDNIGSLAFRYKLNIIPNITATEDEINLADVIDVYVGIGNSRDTLTEENYVGTLAQLMTDPDGAAYGVMLPINGSSDVTLNGEDEDIAVRGSATYCIALKMQETAGNEYQNLSVGEGFKVELLAQQYTWENDSFDNTYDEGSETLGVPVATVTRANEYVNNANLDWNSSFGAVSKNDGVMLETAYRFVPTENATVAAEGPYKTWHGDFIVTFDRDVTAADGIGIAGNYGNWGWIGFKADAETIDALESVGLAEAGVIKAGTELRLLGTYNKDMTISYEALCGLEEFLCGAWGDPAEDLTMTVELRLYEAPSSGTTAPVTVETGKYVTIGKYSYTFSSNYVTLDDGSVLYYADDGEVILCDVDNVTDAKYTIPSAVTTLGNKLLNGNTTIKEVVVPASVKNFGGTPNAEGTGASGGFFYMSSVEKVTLPDGMTEIPVAAFNQATKLTSVNIPSSVKKIGINAFAGSGLTELKIPATVEEIGYGAFRDMAELSTVTIEGDHVTIPNYAFRSCAKLTTVDLKVNTLTLGDNMIFTNTSSNNENPNNITIYVYNDAVYETLSQNSNVKCTIVKVS